MHRRLPQVLLGAGLVALLWAAAAPVSAGPPGGAAPAPRLQMTPFPTPTPGPDGRIIYIVQEGDSPWRIAAIAGITIEELYALNGLQPTDFLVPGMRLQLGLGGPPVATPGAEPEATPTGIPLTPTPVYGTGEICVLLYIDLNGNARREEAEGPLAGGRVSVVSVDGRSIGEHATDDSPEGYCFLEVPNGDYNVSAAVPEDHNATTALSLPVRLDPGTTKFVEFGAQPSGAAAGGGGAAGSTVMGAIGGLLLLGAGGLAYYAYRLGRRPQRFLR